MFGLIISFLFWMLGKKPGWRWKAQYRPTRIPRIIVATILRPIIPSPSELINSLLPELLHAIFELLAFSDHNTLSSCMRVCRRWHDIARPHFFAVVTSGSHPNWGQPFQLLSADPTLAAYVKHVRFMRSCEPYRFFSTPFDIKTLAPAPPALGLVNLRFLTLVRYNNLAHPLPSKYRKTPVHSLRKLTLDNCVGITRILPDLLSLFSVRTLVISLHEASVTPSQWTPGSSIDPSIPLASIAVQNLVLNNPSLYHDVEEFYQFFRHVLIAGSLRALSTTASERQDVSKLGEFLQSSVAQDLRSVSVSLSLFRRLGYTGAAGGAPRFEVSSALGAALAHCARLECFRIGFRNYLGQSGDLLCHRGPEAFEPIVASLPKTLRAFAIDVQVDMWHSWTSFCLGARGLEVVDQLLTPSPGGGGRFPDLQRVGLRILVGEWCLWANKPIKEPRTSPLPRLKAAGLLEVSNVDTHESRGE